MANTNPTLWSQHSRNEDRWSQKKRYGVVSTQSRTRSSLTHSSLFSPACQQHSSLLSCLSPPHRLRFVSKKSPPSAFLCIHLDRQSIQSLHTSAYVFHLVHFGPETASHKKEYLLQRPPTAVCRSTVWSSSAGCIIVGYCLSSQLLQYWTVHSYSLCQKRKRPHDSDRLSVLLRCPVRFSAALSWLQHTSLTHPSRLPASFFC